MNFYINASPLQFPCWSGVQIYTYRILQHMSELGAEHTFHLHFSHKNPGPLDPRVAQLLARKNVRGLFHPGALRSYAALPFSILRSRARVYYLMNGDGRLRIPVPCKTAATVYDCGRYVFPQFYGVRDPVSDLAFAARHLRARDIVITISHTIKAEITRLFEIPPERIAVAPCAMEPIPEVIVPPAALAAHAPPFFLMVNLGRPYKNWQDVLVAFGLCIRRPGTDPALRLILAGELRSESAAIQKALADNPQLAARTLLLGYVSDAELHWLYRHAQALLMPSRYEGFGMPLLEAMSHNTPVITAEIPILREVAADAALFVPLDAPEKLADAMESLPHGSALREVLIARGKARITDFSWPKAAQATLEALAALGRGESCNV